MSPTSPMFRTRLGFTALSMVGVSLLLGGCATSASDLQTESSIVPEADIAALKEQVPAEFSDGITVGTQADIAPLNFVDDDGHVVGFDQNLLGAISDVLGTSIEIEEVPFENLILGLESGTYDFVGDTTIKQERLQKYDMLSYLTSSYSVATVENAEDLGEELTSLCGTSMGIVSGELSGDFVRSTIDPLCADEGPGTVKLTEYKDFASTVLAVRSENVTGMIVDTMTFGYFQAGSAGADFKFNGPNRMAQSDSGYSFLKDQNQELALVVQQALDLLIENGVYEELLGQYGLVESGIEGNSVLNPEASI